VVVGVVHQWGVAQVAEVIALLLAHLVAVHLLKLL
jgi:hypothetical protein